MGYQGEDKFEAFGEYAETPAVPSGVGEPPGNLRLRASAGQVVDEIAELSRWGLSRLRLPVTLWRRAGAPACLCAGGHGRLMSVFRYLLEQGRIETPGDYFAARQYASPAVDPVEEETDGGVLGYPGIGLQRPGRFFAYIDGSGEPPVDFAASGERLTRSSRPVVATARLAGRLVEVSGKSNFRPTHRKHACYPRSVCSNRTVS